METTSPISRVAECTIPECVYNRGSRCYARAITVGNGELPECHTFFTGNHHAAKREEMAGVGACRVFACRHNEGYDCRAGRVFVGYAGQGGYIACLSFSEE